MSKILEQLEASGEPVDRAVARALRIYQAALKSLGKRAHLGYEPRDIKKFGAVKVIEKRVLNKSDGFEIVSPGDSYEAIVVRFQDRFSPEAVAEARRRLNEHHEAFGPTTDDAALDHRSKKLLEIGFPNVPEGQEKPAQVAAVSIVFYRDPKVKAYVLLRAQGCCESCGSAAPFKTAIGLDYLEIHHMRPLAFGGSDRVQNTVALCPNCHRAVHYACDAAALKKSIYEKVSQLVEE
jgi:5-methylcytosine-specific restriction protein A